MFRTYLAIFSLLMTGGVTLADELVPRRLIRAHEIIRADDLLLKKGDTLGSIKSPEDLIGLEAQVALYPGRPIRPGDISQPAIIGRNDLVLLIFSNGGLQISTEGRALGRGAIGDRIRVMNLASRSTLTGTIRSDGAIEIE